MTRGLRETLGSDYAASSLTWTSNGEEGPIDRIVASAWAGGELGRRLTRLKYGGDTSTATLRTAMWMLVEKLCTNRRRFGRAKPTPQLIVQAAAALDEWIEDRCPPPCQAGWLRLDATPRTCPRCNGVGRVAWPDDKRIERTAGAYMAATYERILRRLQEADQHHHNQTKKGLKP